MAERRAVRKRKSALRPLHRPKPHENAVLVEGWRPRQLKGGSFSTPPTPEEADEWYAKMIAILEELALPYPTSVKVFHRGQLSAETMIEPTVEGERGTRVR